MNKLTLQQLVTLWLYFVTKPNWANPASQFPHMDYSHLETQQYLANKLGIDLAVVQDFAQKAAMAGTGLGDVQNTFHALAVAHGQQPYAGGYCPLKADDLG